MVTIGSVVREMGMTAERTCSQECSLPKHLSFIYYYNDKSADRISITDHRDDKIGEAWRIDTKCKVSMKIEREESTWET
jgi:hypothetical protein